MSRSATTSQTERTKRQEAVAEFDRLRAEIADDLKGLTVEEQEALFDRWTADVDDGLRQRVLRHRGETGVPKP